jgi:peptidoglycan/xylan/chitin deacetylase (PgdA/CDA1 family)
MLCRRRSVILCYHGVGPTSTRLDPGFLRVRPDVFRAQLDLLLGAGFEFVTVAELADRSAGAEPPPGLAALSFDDGMDDNHAVVLPILTELRLTATVYVATGLIGKPNPWMAPEAGARMMDELELRELAAAGFEIGAHSVTHPDLSQLDYERCLREMTESRATLERVVGAPVRTFAYPFCRYGPAALAAVQAAGFTAAVTCQGLGSWDRYELERSLITGKDGLPVFLLKLTDAYQPLFDSGPSRLVRTATRTLREHRRERAQARRAGG